TRMSLASGQTTAAVLPAARDGVMTPEEIAVVDPLMRNYLEERERRQNSVDELKAAGVGENNPRATMAASALSAVIERVMTYAQAYKEVRALAAQDFGTAAHPAPTMKSKQDFEANEQRLTKLHQDARKEMVAIGAKR